jgi:hypothetical protein
VKKYKLKVNNSKKKNHKIEKVVMNRSFLFVFDNSNELFLVLIGSRLVILEMTFSFLFVFGVGVHIGCHSEIDQKLDYV